jgi:hypothetical protein
MRVVTLLVIMIIYAIPLQAQAMVTAASCSRADVAAAVASATYGDTVTVPACAPTTWTSALTITKGIILHGAGAGSTTIVPSTGFATSYLIVYNPDSTSISQNTPFEVSGFTFDLNNNVSQKPGGIWLNNTSATTAITRVKIHDNDFKNLTSDGTSTSVACLQVGENGDVWGVAYLNTFTNCVTGGYNYGGYQNSWNNTTFAYGSQNNFYWEDNTLTGNSAFHYGGHGGRYVARFNTYTFTGGDFQVVWDIHGNQPSGVYGTMGCEIYRNTVSLARSTTIFDDRGGSCMFYQNTFTGTDGSWQIREEYDDSIDPTSNSQPQHVSNTYYFLNILNGSNHAMSETQDCCAAITPNVDYFDYTASFTGATGVGSGTLAARPATCTTGVGYWATDQGAWNTLGADGLFYKCTSTNTWSLYYTPLTYPHPLRSGAGQTTDSTPPAAPTNLRVL